VCWPTVGAIVGIGSVALWRRRNDDRARLFLAAAVGTTAWWSAQLLGRTPAWHPMLRHLVLVGGVALAGVIAIWPARARRAGVVVASLALAVTLAGPASYAWATAAQPHSGAIPSAGPNGGLGGFGPGGRGGPGGPGGGGGGFPGGPGGAGFPGGGGRGGGGGILNGSTSNAALTAALQAGGHQYTWAAAAVSANQAAGYQLASGEPVMAIGGFNGTDPSPTLAQFQEFVRQGRIHYFIGGGGGFGGGFGGGRGGGSGTSSQITAWVQQNFTATTIGGTTVYDLTATS